jgi:hypothetical protein
MKRWIFITLLFAASLAQAQISVGGRAFVRSPNELGTKGEWVLYEKDAPQD